MTDSEAINSVLKGNRNDFRILVERYQQTVFRIVIGFVHNKEESQDLTQEVFINAFKSLEKFRGDSSFSTWLHRITVNACLNYTRKNKATIFTRITSFLSSENENNFVIPTAEDPEETLIKAEHAAWLQKALDSLPLSQRTAIILSKYDDMPQKEIAQIMNTSESAVEALIQRAKRNLREKLVTTKKNF
ncbi:MAG TPA: RNA polymerase sigma factor [Bacteroidales bacterium]|nr:RNA polymerase sigma factor [Bacteroidales bacterium]